MWMGPALLTGNFWFLVAFCFFYWVYYERIMFAEEQFLRRKFGTIYTDWAEKVPAFVPDFKKFKKPEQAFSWIKIIKKEINGLVGILIIFTLFDVLGHLVQNEANYNYFISVPCGIIILMYLVLRYIKKRTALLNEMGE